MNGNKGDNNHPSGSGSDKTPGKNPKGPQNPQDPLVHNTDEKGKKKKRVLTDSQKARKKEADRKRTLRYKESEIGKYSKENKEKYNAKRRALTKTRIAADEASKTGPYTVPTKVPSDPIREAPYEASKTGPYTVPTKVPSDPIREAPYEARKAQAEVRKQPPRL